MGNLATGTETRADACVGDGIFPVLVVNSRCIFSFFGQMTAHDDFATCLPSRCSPRLGLRKYPGFLNHWSPKLVLEWVEGGRAGRGIGGCGGGCDYGVFDVW